MMTGHTLPRVLAVSYRRLPEIHLTKHNSARPTELIRRTQPVSSSPTLVYKGERLVKTNGGGIGSYGVTIFGRGSEFYLATWAFAAARG